MLFTLNKDVINYKVKFNFTQLTYCNKYLCKNDYSNSFRILFLSLVCIIIIYIYNILFSFIFLVK